MSAGAPASLRSLVALASARLSELPINFDHAGCQVLSSYLPMMSSAAEADGAD
jgi:hypothetical protein